MFPQCCIQVLNVLIHFRSMSNNLFVLSIYTRVRGNHSWQNCTRVNTRSVIGALINFVHWIEMKVCVCLRVAHKRHCIQHTRNRKYVFFFSFFFFFIHTLGKASFYARFPSPNVICINLSTKPGQNIRVGNQFHCSIDSRYTICI